jgi:hypothetical protein
MGPISWTEMSVRNCHYSLRKNTEERSYQERDIIPDRELTVSVYRAQDLFQLQPAILTPNQMNFASDVSHKLSRDVTFSSYRFNITPYFTGILNRNVSIFIIKSKFLYLPTDAQLNCLKNNFKNYIKIDIKTAPTCFGAITIIR